MFKNIRTMNMEFVSFEIAKKLKEKGYPMAEIPTGGIDNRNIPVLYDLPKEHPNWQDCKAWWVPTISQVLKWLREEHHLHFEVVGAAYGYNLIISDTPDKGGTDRYYSHANNDGPNYAGAWDKYEDCVMYGIEYALDNLI